LNNSGGYLCNSRLIEFIDYMGRKVHADWGDEIIKNLKGLFLIRNHKFD